MRILLLSTYPAANPRHGGQHRLHQIARRLEAAGHQVDLRGVLGSPSYPLRSGYVRFPDDKILKSYLDQPTLMEDWAIGKYAADRNGGYRQLSALCGTDYDIVFCEQPWLFEFAYHRFGSLERRPALVYGSQNIEHRLKREIVDQYLTKALAEEYGGLVEESELFAIRNSDLSVAVSEEDANWLRGVSDNPVIVAANGVADRRASIEDVKNSNALTGQRKFALYCASGHPPNIQGFYDIFESGLGCLSPEQILVVAGGAGPSISADPRFGRAAGLERKLVVTGEIGESQLRGLLATAHLIILPITRGGGTNLKTAEALWAGRHVVATSMAMRGFEQFTAVRGLTISDGAADFKRAIEQTMGRREFQLQPEERALRSSVLWESTLRELTAALHQLWNIMQ